jgi:hypothetical protein
LNGALTGNVRIFGIGSTEQFSSEVTVSSLYTCESPNDFIAQLIRTIHAADALIVCARAIESTAAAVINSRFAHEGRPFFNIIISCT